MSKFNVTIFILILLTNKLIKMYILVLVKQSYHNIINIIYIVQIIF